MNRTLTEFGLVLVASLFLHEVSANLTGCFPSFVPYVEPVDDLMADLSEIDLLFMVKENAAMAHAKVDRGPNPSTNGSRLLRHSKPMPRKVESIADQAVDGRSALRRRHLPIKEKASAECAEDAITPGISPSPKPHAGCDEPKNIATTRQLRRRRVQAVDTTPGDQGREACNQQNRSSWLAPQLACYHTGARIQTGMRWLPKAGWLKQDRSELSRTASPYLSACRMVPVCASKIGGGCGGGLQRAREVASWKKIGRHRTLDRRIFCGYIN